MNGTELALLGIILLIVHFSVPLMYFKYFKKNWFPKRWNLVLDNDYRPKVTVIVPAHNEEASIAKRLDNITAQQYPREQLRIIVVDDGSIDATVQEVAKWQERNPDSPVRVRKQPERSGKMYAIQHTLKEVSTPFIIVADADALWEEHAVLNTMKYFADPSVCAVTASLKYIGKTGTENMYRNFYNVLTVAESKRHSTPLQTGVLQAIRMEFLHTFGLPLYPGSEDCAIASYMAFLGFRAIRADDVWGFYDDDPLRGGYLRTKIRRAQHNILNFLLIKSYVRNRANPVKSAFDLIWRFEWYLYIVNPWILIASTLLILFGSLALRSTLGLALLFSCGIILTLSKRARYWVSQQFYLTIALFRNLYNRQVTW